MDMFEDDDAPESADARGANAPEFTVSELSGAVKKVVEGAFDHVRVRGELGRVSRPRSGHIYLDLKDDRAVLSGIIWKGVAARLDIDPEEGMEVVATGKLTTYPGQSRYQIIIDSLAPAGMGALMALLEKRKAALAAEGLFATERKRALPYLPRTIGVVTSPSGAVIRDILHRLAERFPMRVLVWPVAVQGKACAPEVANAIRGFNAMSAANRPDVLIVARGGGSVEDLWGFNEEAVARAAAASEIPLISAVGHETDTTLIDYVSDRRAPTPTAAAEMAAPVRGELLATLAALEERRARAVARLFEDQRRRLRDLARILPKPDEILSERRQRLDAAAGRLPLALRHAAERKRGELRAVSRVFGPRLLEARNAERRRRTDDLARRLGLSLRGPAQRARDGLSVRVERLSRQPERLARRTAEEARRLNVLAAGLSRAGARRTETARERLARSARLLEGLNPKNVLARGYAIVRGEGGVVSSASALTAGAALAIEFSDGVASAVGAGGAAGAPGAAAASPKRAGAAAKPKPKPKPKPGQGELDL